MGIFGGKKQMQGGYGDKKHVEEPGPGPGPGPELEPGQETDPVSGGHKKSKGGHKKSKGGYKKTKGGKKHNKGKTHKKTGNWIAHVKAYCRKTGKNFREALSDPKCKAEYRKKH